MKALLLYFSLLCYTSSMAQETKKPVPFLISAQGKTIDAFLDSDNSKKVLLLQAHADKYSKLVIVNSNAKNETAFNRSYMLVDETDNQLSINFTSRIVGTTTVFLNDIFKLTQKGKTYKLYTMAVPKDPQVAATVRVARILLGNIAVK